MWRSWFFRPLFLTKKSFAIGWTNRFGAGYRTTDTEFYCFNLLQQSPGSATSYPYKGQTITVLAVTVAYRLVFFLSTWNNGSWDLFWVHGDWWWWHIGFHIEPRCPVLTLWQHADGSWIRLPDGGLLVSPTVAEDSDSAASVFSS